MKNSVVFSDSGVFDKVSDNNIVLFFQILVYLTKFLTIIYKIRTTVDMLSGHSDQCLL